MDTTRASAGPSKEKRDQRINDVVARILACSGTALASATGQDTPQDVGTLEHEARTGTRRVDTGASDREDTSEVKYRQVRLEKVVLVSLRTTQSEEETENSLCELTVLAKTAGSRMLDNIIQHRMKLDPTTYLGSSKARELANVVCSVEADTAIVDEKPAPSQCCGPEDVVDAEVVNCMALTFDIFARHVKSRGDKAQVGLAQFECLLPRLCGWGESMSRQASGRVAGGADIGSRGSGETKTELDRRRVRMRMARLCADIAHMEPARRTQRNSCCRGAAPSVATAGYANAGKLTLLNRLTDAGVLIQDALFAMLDPMVRRARAVNSRGYTLTDAVSFVRNLPTQLIEALRSTLGEVGQADIIVHVVDVAHPNLVPQIQAVRSVIDTIGGVSEIPELIVLDRADLVSSEQAVLLRMVFPGAVPLSTCTGWGVEALCAVLEDMLLWPRVAIDAILPYSTGSLVHRIYEENDVERGEYVETGTRIAACVDETLTAVIAHEVVGDTVGDAAVSGE